MVPGNRTRDLWGSAMCPETGSCISVTNIGMLGTSSVIAEIGVGVLGTSVMTLRTVIVGLETGAMSPTVSDVSPGTSARGLVTVGKASATSQCWRSLHWPHRRLAAG